MRTITVLGWRRPDYLRRTLEALAKCRGVKNYHIFVSIDDAEHQMETLLAAHGSMPALFGHDQYHLLAPGKHFGVDDHPKNVYDIVFGNQQSDFNVMLEDDVVPALDALELADWFYENGQFQAGLSADFVRDRKEIPEYESGRYAALLLHSGSTDQSNPLALNELSRFCPWGWATTREMWDRWWAPNWNCKQNEPCHGRDFSMGVVIQRNVLKCLKPALSRSLNIGREGGVYETPGHHDEWTKGLVSSDGTHGKEYFVQGRLQPGYDNDMDGWVKEAVTR
jgi:hypothetical protein